METQKTEKNSQNSSETVSLLDRTSTLIVAVFLVGPFALPLVWKNSKYSAKTKVILSVVIIALTLLLVVFTVKTGSDLFEEFRRIQSGVYQ